MLLQLVGIDQKEQFNVTWVELQTLIGNIIIQPQHAPMILQIQQNSQIRFCLDSGKQKTIDILAGIAHVTREDVTILISNNL